MKVFLFTGEPQLKKGESNIFHSNKNRSRKSILAIHQETLTKFSFLKSGIHCIRLKIMNICKTMYLMQAPDKSQ